MASRFASNEDFIEALKDPLYSQIREALYSINESNRFQERLEELNIDFTNLPEEHLTTSKLDDFNVMDQKVHSDNHASESPQEIMQVSGAGALCEIEEVGTEDSKSIEDQVLIKKTTERSHVSGRRNIAISSEVKKALETLEKAISMVREYGLNEHARISFGFTHEEPPKKSNAGMDKSLEEDGVCSNIELSKKEAVARTSSHESVRNSFGIHSFR